jgi:serine/threonine protein kinase
MRQLKHQGIVELHEFSESDDHYFLVLELAPGGELFHRIVKLTYFSEELTRHVIVQVAQAIRYLHEEKGVIHRDIKPENILFEPIPIIPSPPGFRPDEEDKEDEGIFQPGVGGGGIGCVKIADFGLSKVVWDEQTMTPCGTVGYTAPEIVKDERYSKSVDMWAMGCVLYTLLCGFPPFYDESIQALTEKVARGQYTFLSPWWDEISHEGMALALHLSFFCASYPSCV